MKRPQTKFHTDAMSDSNLLSQKSQNFLFNQNLLTAEFFSYSIFYGSYNNTYCCVFASLVAILKDNDFLRLLTE